MKEAAGDAVQRFADSFRPAQSAAGVLREPVFPITALLRARRRSKRLPDGHVFVTRYDDVEFVYKNPKIFSSDKKQEFRREFGATRVFETTRRAWCSTTRPFIPEFAGSSRRLTPRAVAQIQPDLVAQVIV